MTRDDIIRMAREAGCEIRNGHIYHQFSLDQMLKRFDALARAAEREACAEQVGVFAQKWWSIHCASNKHMETTRKAHDDFCALQVAIRTRGNK